MDIIRDNFLRCNVTTYNLSLAGRQASIRRYEGNVLQCQLRLLKLVGIS